MYTKNVLLEISPLYDKTLTGIGLSIKRIIESLERYSYLYKDEFSFHLAVRVSRYIKTNKNRNLYHFPTFFIEDPISILGVWKKIHIFHSLSGYMPIYPFVPKITTIHDIFPINKKYSSSKFLKKQAKE
jgi:hypothetical protein